MQNAEALFLWRYFGKAPTLYDFLIGTIPFSTGAFLLSLRLRLTPKLKILSKLGATYSLGIYVFHLYFLTFLERTFIWTNWVLLIPTSFFLTIIFLAIIFRIFPGFKRFLHGDQIQFQKIDNFSFLPAALPLKKDSDLQ